MVSLWLVFGKRIAANSFLGRGGFSYVLIASVMKDDRESIS